VHIFLLTETARKKLYEKRGARAEFWSPWTPKQIPKKISSKHNTVCEVKTCCTFANLIQPLQVLGEPSWSVLVVVIIAAVNCRHGLAYAGTDSRTPQHEQAVAIVENSKASFDQKL